VKSIEVRAAFRKVLSERCIHYRALDDSDLEWDEVGGMGDMAEFEKFTANLMPLFQQLKNQSLKSFG